jgi:hypothetical protein
VFALRVEARQLGASAGLDVGDDAGRVLLR